MGTVPQTVRWALWELDVDALEVERDADGIIWRILERGGIEDVRWLLGALGRGRIHRFLRERGHPELSRRTLAFWRAALYAEDETWASPPDWRRSCGAPWID